MEVGKNSVIYMGPLPGPNTANDICGKTTVTGTMQQGSTVLVVVYGATAQYWVLASSGFETFDVLQGEAVSHSPNPQPGGQGLCVYDFWIQSGPDIALGIE
jgi:hypothetical protein